jgi:hypothetical protein
VREAYLRISWYPTLDASGPAMGTTDSLERVGGSAGGFSFLTTGAVAPPAGAASARVRVMLVPLGGGPASLRIDDVSFAVSAAPTPTPSTTATPTVTETPPTAPSVPLLGAIPTAAPQSGLIVGPSPDARRAVTAGGPDRQEPLEVRALPTVAEVESARSEPREAPGQPAPAPPDPLLDPREPEREVPWLWLAGVALVVIGLGGLFLQNRGRPR